MIAERFRPRYHDPFAGVLVNPLSLSFEVSQEQKDAIKEILDIACSDSFFSQKAYAAIVRVLTSGPVTVPAVISLSPSTIVIGDPSTTLHVHGTGFTGTSVIVFNGFEEPTTFVSDTEVTTGIDMSVWAAPVVVPVMVSTNGIPSNSMNFEFTSSTSLHGPGPTLHSAPKHDPYAPIPSPGSVPIHPVKQPDHSVEHHPIGGSNPISELMEHHSIKSAKEEAELKSKIDKELKNESDKKRNEKE